MTRGDRAEIAASSGLRIARFGAAAKVVVGRRSAGVRHRIARVHRASNAITAVGRRAGDAAVHAADLGAIAEIAVVARKILGKMRACSGGFVALVRCASNVVVAIDVGRIRAAGVDVARFDAVAGKPVVANGVVGDMNTRPILRIARIKGAADVVVAIHRCARHAENTIARFLTIAGITVVALRVHRARHGGDTTPKRRNAALTHGAECRVCRGNARSTRLLAALDRTGDTVTVETLHAGSSHATRAHRARRAARFHAVARQSVITNVVVGHEVASIGRFIAAVGRARSVVIANDRTAGFAPDVGIARLGAIAIKPVAASRIVGDVIATVRCFITAVGRARNAVVAIDRRPHDTPDHGIACFHAVAEKPIRAQIVVFDVPAFVECLIAEVIGARNLIVAIERRAIDAAEHRIAGFNAVASDFVAAKLIVGRIRTGIHRFIASVHRARNPIVTRWSGARCATRSRSADCRIAGFRAIAIQAVAACGMIGGIETSPHRANVDCTGKTVVTIRIVYTNRRPAAFSAHTARSRRSSSRSAGATHTAGTGNISAHSAGATHTAGTGNISAHATGTHSACAPGRTPRTPNTACAPFAARTTFATCTGRTRFSSAARTGRHIRSISPASIRIGGIAAAADHGQRHRRNPIRVPPRYVHCFLSRKQGKHRAVSMSKLDSIFLSRICRSPSQWIRNGTENAKMAR